MKRAVVWERLDFKGIEHLVFENAGQIKKASGYVVGVYESAEPFAVAYQIDISAEWKVSAFRVTALDKPEKQIEMISDENGAWRNRSGARQAEFDGCFDIDITLTPFTNTLPVSRLEFADGEKKKISVLYIELPEFKIKRVEQFYTRLSERVFVYEGYPKGFRAEIQFDEDGFVTNYPEIFRRIYP